MESPNWSSSAFIASTSLLALLMINYRASKRASSQSVDDEITIELNDKGEREITKKQKLMKKVMLKGSSSSSSSSTLQPTTKWSNGAIPPGNFRTISWLQTDLSAPIQDPAYSLEESKYRLTLVLGERKLVLALEELQSLGMKKFEKVDWHCVTGWSYLGLTLYGIPIKRLLSVLGEELVDDPNQWKWLFQVSADGYTCPVFREDTMRDDVFFALRDETGSLLSVKHGGPRFIFPSLWGWKSSKYLTEVRLLREYVPGFWEKLMCHPRGRIYDDQGNYLEERWAPSARKHGVHDFLTGLVNIYHRLFGARVYSYTMSIGGWILGKLAKPLLAVNSDPSTTNYPRPVSC